MDVGWVHPWVGLGWVGSYFLGISMGQVWLGQTRTISKNPITPSRILGTSFHDIDTL